MKNWANYTLKVNGLDIETTYNQDTIKNIFEPFLKRITKLYQEKQQRIVIFMAAPPAVGKTTLSLFLEQLSKTNDDFEEIQAIGLDGFHYHSDYLASHEIKRDGKVILMNEVKGCPETFDIDKLKDKLAKLKKENITWPIYDRKLHDVVEDMVVVEKNIILFEGNWLLLQDEEWQDLSIYSDLTVMIKADASMLKERLINRKVQGGYSLDEATSFYEKSDSRNVQRALQDSRQADLTWTVLADGDYQ